MVETRLPGLGRALDYIPEKNDSDFIGTPFPTALDIMDKMDDTSFECRWESMGAKKCVRTICFINVIYLYFCLSRLPMTTLREFAMLQLMNVITDKKNWNTKVRRASML